jgi:hypothetical protein
LSRAGETKMKSGIAIISEKIEAKYTTLYGYIEGDIIGLELKKT